MKQLKTGVTFITAVVVSCVVRVCQILFMTDPATGFYFPRYETLGLLLTLLYVALFAATAVLSFLEIRGCAKFRNVSVFRTIALFLAAIAVLGQIPSALSASPLIAAIQIVLALGAAAFFAAEAPEGVLPIKIKAEYRQWLSIFPVCFWLVRTLLAFSHYMTVANISENIFDLSAMGFLCLFFLLYGKSVNGVDGKKTVRLLVPSGLCASMLCFVCSVPRIAAILLGANSIHGTAGIGLIYIAMGIAVPFMLPKRISRKEAENK